MRLSLRSSIRFVLGIGFISAVTCAGAQDVARGQALWYNAPGVKNNTTIMACQACHSQGPTIRMGRTATQINVAIVGNTGGMGIFNNVLNVGGAASVDLLDLQAYLVNPAAVPLAIATTSPAANVTLGNQALGSESAALTVTLSNVAPSAAPFQLAAANAISLTGTNAADFTIAAGGTCANSTTLAVGASCTVNLTFKPTGAVGLKNAALRLSFSTLSVPAIQLFLTGNATAAATPTISLSANSIDFGNQVQGTTSPAQSVTLTNSGGASLAIATLTTGGTNAAEFTRGGTCAEGGTVLAGANCTITYTFTPAAIANGRTAALTIASNNPAGNVTLNLSGNGIADVPAITVTPLTLTFSTVTGQTSAVQNVTVRNSGGGTLTVANATSAAPYTITNGCAAGLTQNQTCTIGVAFTPIALGAANGTLAIAHNVAGSPTNVTLNGTGVSAVPLVSVNPALMTFTALTAVGQQSNAQRVTFNNAGPGTVTISAISSTSEFPVVAPATGACAVNGTVAQGASCFVDLRFAPAGAGARAGTLTISNNGSPSTASVPLAGTGSAVAQPILGYAPAGGPLFAPTQAGTTATAIRVTITNVGTANMVFPASGVAAITTGFNPTDFRVAATTCAATTPLQPNTGNCTVDVTFAPVAAGAATRTAILLISHSGGADQVPLTGVVIGATGAGTPAPPPSTGGGTNPSAAPTGGGSGGGGELAWQWLGLLFFLSLAAGRRRQVVCK